MDVMVSRCAGVDVGKAEVVACLGIPGSRGRAGIAGADGFGGRREDESAGGLVGRTPGQSRRDGGDWPVLGTGLGCVGQEGL